MRNIEIILICTIASAVILPRTCSAYELSTHAGISYKATTSSTISSSAFFDRIGLLSANRKLGGIYYDLADASGASISIRPRIAGTKGIRVNCFENGEIVSNKFSSI